MMLEIERYRGLLDNNDELISYIIDKSEETRWFYERYLYFKNCAGDSCRYADACIKMMKEDIDEFCARKSADNTA